MDELKDIFNQIRNIDFELQLKVQILVACAVLLIAAIAGNQ